MFVSSSVAATACLVVTLAQPSPTPASAGETPPVSAREGNAESWDSLPTSPDAKPEPATPPTIRLQWQPIDPPDPDHLARLRHRAAISRAKTMTIGGWSTVGVSYLFSAIAGTTALDIATAPDDPLRRYGRRMLIPVAGPIMAAFEARTASGALLTALLGVGQVVGLGVATVGHVRLRRLRRELRLSASPTSIAMRF